MFQRIAARLAVAVIATIVAVQAQAYETTASVTFAFGGNGGGTPYPTVVAPVTPGADITWTQNGPHSLTTMSNDTYFTTLGGYNGIGYYNADFATTAGCVADYGTTATARKYGCRWTDSAGDPYFNSVPVVDDGPGGGRASGTLQVTDTRLTGVLQILSSTDEPTGATTTFSNRQSPFTGTYGRLSNSAGNGFDGYNYRAADGSPFGNFWQGITTAGTLTVDLTGTFTATGWSITGGTVKYTDPGYACQQGGFGALYDAPSGTLCTELGVAGGHAHTGAHLSWGWDLDGARNGDVLSEIEVRDGTGSFVVASLSGVLASLTVDPAGNLVTTAGEYRRGSDPSTNICGPPMRWDGTRLLCGALTVGLLDISGTVAPVPVPAAGLLLATGFAAAAAAARRRRAFRSR